MSLLYALSPKTYSLYKTGWQSSVVISGSVAKRLRLELWEWNKLNSGDFVGCAHLDHALSDARKGKPVDVWQTLICKGTKIDVSVRIKMQLTQDHLQQPGFVLWYIFNFLKLPGIEGLS